MNEKNDVMKWFCWSYFITHTVCFSFSFLCLYSLRCFFSINPEKGTKVEKMSTSRFHVNTEKPQDFSDHERRDVWILTKLSLDLWLDLWHLKMHLRFKGLFKAKRLIWITFCFQSTYYDYVCENWQMFLFTALWLIQFFF